MQTSSTDTLIFDDASLANQLFGSRNANLTVIAERAGVILDTRGTSITITGGNAQQRETVRELLTQLYGLLKSGHPVYSRDIAHAYTMLEREPSTNLRRVFREEAFIVSPRKTIAAKTLSQRDYVAALRDFDMVFGVGPAGTGKTYLAVATALSYLQARKVKRIILTRPAVEAGEKLGFLPGDMVEKVNPYLRPLYDALHDMLDFQKVAEMLETGVIEIAPLAFMRGRTLNDAFVILDEAQNTTQEQMKMFLTRLGFGSHVVITGDVTQIDLPSFGKDNAMNRSGLVHAVRVLEGVQGIRIIHFHEADVIRHPLVGRIVQAYDKHENKPNRTV